MLRTTDKTRVLVADDHLLVSQGLCRILENEEDMECVAMAADGGQAAELALDHHPDVAMPGMNGIEATKKIKENCPNTAVLIVSAYKYDEYVLACIEAGADGYLLKDNARSDNLPNAIRMILSGENVFGNEASMVMRKLITSKGRHRIGSNKLGNRELEVLKLAAQGLNNKQVAHKLGISDQTVASHLGHIFRKLDVESRMEAVLYALREGWIGLNDPVMNGDDPTQLPGREN